MNAKILKGIEFYFLVFVPAVSIYMHNAGSLSGFALIFSSIVLEALPFMIVGSLIGGVIEVFVKPETVASIIPKNRFFAALFGGAMGLVFPVCECGIVPVAKRLASKGMPVSAVIAYLLGGPIFNPIVFISTMVAYGGSVKTGLLRAAAGYFIAVLIGAIIGCLFDKKKAFVDMSEHDDQCCCGHDHKKPQKSAETARGKMTDIFRHATHDFFSVTHFLIIGAFIAALAQHFIARREFASFGHGVFLEPALMMTLAVLLNLCSEADAFIAASFRGIVSLPAQMAFLITGPMFDLKLLLMYKRLLKPKAVAALVVLILAIVYVSSVVMWAAGVGK